MKHSALIAFCIAALSILAVPTLRADQCSALVDEYNAGRRRQEDYFQELIEKIRSGYRGGYMPTRDDFCALSRFQLLERQRELAIVKRFFPECAAQLPRLPSGKVCDVVCREELVAGSKAVVRGICGGS